MNDWKTLLKMADTDVEGAISRFSNKEDRYVKYLKLFYRDENYDKLIAALDANDAFEAFEACHALKGIAGNLGFKTLYSGVFEACEILRNGKTEGVRDIIDDVSDNYHVIIEIIADNLNN